MLRRAALFLVLLMGCGANAAPATTARPSDRRLSDFAAAVARFGTPVSAPAAPQSCCPPLAVDTWAPNPALEIHEATACRYRVAWHGWSPPHEYDYVPDEGGWISDYFISSGHGRVFWNLRTNAAVVRPMEDQPPLDAADAESVAEWARATNFPGLDLATVTFTPTPCAAARCGPY